MGNFYEKIMILFFLPWRKNSDTLREKLPRARPEKNKKLNFKKHDSAMSPATNIKKYYYTIYIQRKYFKCPPK